MLCSESISKSGALSSNGEADVTLKDDCIPVRSERQVFTENTSGELSS
jgi:hypothetical protein